VSQKILTAERSAAESATHEIDHALFSHKANRVFQHYFPRVNKYTAIPSQTWRQFRAGRTKDGLQFKRGNKVKDLLLSLLGHLSQCLHCLFELFCAHSA
jgi:hypothetical protein